MAGHKKLETTQGGYASEMGTSLKVGQGTLQGEGPPRRRTEGLCLNMRRQDSRTADTHLGGLVCTKNMRL